MRILIVDDEKILVESLVRGLKSRGYGVIGTLTAEEGLSKLHIHHDVDLVLTDHVMPDINGIELLKRIRQIRKDLPVIMMTAYGEKYLVIEAMRNGCSGFIEKPFSLDELVREIERAKGHVFKDPASPHSQESVPKLLHQINNPLMTILGNAELGMFELENQDATRSRLERIIQATEEIRELNRMILDPGWRTGKRAENLDLVNLLKECLGFFKDLMRVKGVDLIGELPEGGRLRVKGDRFRLRQVFRNLIMNAVEAMDEKEKKRLKVTAKQLSSSSFVWVSFEDTGWGVSTDLLGKIYEPYITSKENGTGLGLTVVRDIVREHGGRIEVMSRVGEGTTFRVFLPGVNGRALMGHAPA
ncbi:MAG: response regulator [Deltaproteobacteria bacterium]|nr:response regulator [Deltaproteobacteria bacterium]